MRRCPSGQFRRSCSLWCYYDARERHRASAGPRDQLRSSSRQRPPRAGSRTALLSSAVTGQSSRGLSSMTTAIDLAASHDRLRSEPGDWRPGDSENLAGVRVARAGSPSWLPSRRHGSTHPARRTECVSSATARQQKLRRAEASEKLWERDRRRWVRCAAGLCRPTSKREHAYQADHGGPA